MRNTLFPITTKDLKVGIARFNIMLLDAKSTDDMKNILPYCNLVLNHLGHKKEKKLSDEVFENFWKRHEELVHEI